MNYYGHLKYREQDISNALYSVTDFLYCLQWHKIGEHTVTSIYNQRYNHDWNKPLYKTEQCFTKHIVTFCERYLRIIKTTTLVVKDHLLFLVAFPSLFSTSQYPKIHKTMLLFLSLENLMFTARFRY